LLSDGGVSALAIDAPHRSATAAAAHDLSLWSKTNDFAAWAPWPNRRIDYIFIAQPRLDGAGMIEHCSVVCDEKVDDVWPSDHFGVFARLRTKS
jgi:endonuclease/exonuclease/phosphatase family metal-dependent hydrolase